MHWLCMSLCVRVCVKYNNKIERKKKTTNCLLDYQYGVYTIHMSKWPMLFYVPK